MSVPTHATLSELSIDNTVNARTAKRGPEPEFAASIRAVGIIEPLIVRKNGKGYTVTNGSKRFDALQFLKEQKGMAKGVLVTDEFEVPIVLREETDAQARETSLMTHIIRSELHPVEEFRAFSRSYEDMLAQKLPHADAVLAIARRYGIAAKYVEQSLALANLDDKILDAWVKGEIEQEAAQAFTLCPDKKAQVTIFTKLSKSDDRITSSDIKNALRIADENPGRLLNAIGIEAYEKRGGKVHRDLFGADHVVSNEKLAKTMAIEAVDAKCKALVADGWAWAIPQDDVQNRHSFGRVNISAKPTPEEQAKLDELEDKSNDWGFDDDERESAGAEHDQLAAAINARAYTAEQKAKSGCFVYIDHLGNIAVDAGRVKPEEKKAVAAQERKVEKQKKTKAGVPEEPKEISGALAERLSKTLTSAAYWAIKDDPKLGLALAITALQVNGPFGDSASVCLKNSGVLAREADEELDFADRFKTVSKLKQPQQLELLAAIVGTSFDFVVHHASQSPLTLPADARDTAQFVCNQIDPKALNKQLRTIFDAKDYFDGVSKSYCLAAITEALNADEARKVSGKPKGEIAKFAVDNVPKTGWLPPELRTANYDGPKAKGKAAATPAKKRR